MTGLHLRPPVFETVNFNSQEDLAVTRARRTMLIEGRQREVARAQRPLVDWLSGKGVSSISSFWIANTIVAKVPASMLSEIEARPEVDELGLDYALSPATANWDGENGRLAAGLNAAKYLDNGYTGLGTTRRLRIAFLDFFFNATHPIFRDGPGTYSRVVGTFACTNMLCNSDAGLPVPPPGNPHGSICASVAAGDAMDLQIPGLTFAERVDRSGIAEEAEMLFLTTSGTMLDTIAGLQQAVDSGSDVVSESFGGRDSQCDGDYTVTPNSPWNIAVYNAEQLGVLVVGVTANEGWALPDGKCDIAAIAEAPSLLVVGGVVDPGSGSYASTGFDPQSGEGGVNASLGAFQINRAFSQVGLVAPTTWFFSAGSGSTFTLGGGTSVAGPQVAGSAILFKHWAIANGFAAQTAQPGWLYANMLAMGDRAIGPASYAQSGFSPIWGGGRFQLRYYGVPAEDPGAWRWETARYVLGSGSRVDHIVGGYGSEPVGLQQFKVYALVLEPDAHDVADVDIQVLDNNCGTYAQVLGADYSYDYKSMVRLGPEAGGRSLCVRLLSQYMPPGETRAVQLVVQYSTATAMR